MNRTILGILTFFLTGGQLLAQDLPSNSDFCGDAKDSAYTSGFTNGYTGGYSDGFRDGYGTGYSEGYNDSYSDAWSQATSNCRGDPASCSITLDSVLTSGGYGETEPNDNMASADALLGDVKFTGQSYGWEDQDWYYLVTTKPNQILTVYFSVPMRDPDSTSASDWVIDVRDGTGSLYATFGTDFLNNNPKGDDQIAYPVTLGLVGTYYIVVKPSGDPTLDDMPSAYPYELAAILRDSDVTNPPLDRKFFDTEVEPNNLYTQANPISSSVTMYGLINLTFDSVVVPPDDLDGTWAQGEPDWFVYTTEGNEIISLSFCDKEVCEPGDWFIQIFDEAGAAAVSGGGTATPLVAFNTASGQEWPDTVNFGLVAPGKYYMLINHKRKFEAPCVQTRTVQQCLNLQGTCLKEVCTFTPDTQPDPPLPEGLSCSCGEGTVCLATVSRGEEKITGVCRCTDERVPSCGFADNKYKDVCWKEVEQCVQYGSVVEIPGDEVSSQYNFTWYGTQIPPLAQ